MLKLNIDTAAIAAQFKEMALEVEQDLQKGVANLAALTHAKILEDSQQELHSTRKTYAEAFKEVQEISPGVFVLTLDESAMFIEEGIKENTDMKPDLLKNAKTSPSGKKYKVIPFDYGKSPSNMTGYTQAVVSQIKNNLKQRGVPYKKIEYNKDGSPRLGKLHEFDFGGTKPGKGNTPVMKGVSIYQSMAGGKVRRDIMTFRTVTNGPEQADKWVHPGLTPKHFFEKAQAWALNEWEQHILPDILGKWGK